MRNLELVGLHEDGEHVVLAAPDGEQFELPISEELRAAVRRDRPGFEHLRAEGPSAVPPREIQARLRAGATIEEVAEGAGLSIDHVRRFEGPIAAERDFILERVQAWRPAPDSAPLGTLVEQRMEARAADPESVRWTATRKAGAPWTIRVTFEVGAGGERTASWSFAPASKTLSPLDDEARWLCQAEVQEPIRDTSFDKGSRAARHVDEGPTGRLLDDLVRRRGVRGEPAGVAPALFPPMDRGEPDPEPRRQRGGRVVEIHPEHPAGRALEHPPAPSPAPEQGELNVPSPPRLQRRGEAKNAASQTSPFLPVSVGPPDDDPDDDPPQGPPKKPKRATRAKVPSLDDIVYGAKPRQ